MSYTPPSWCRPPPSEHSWSIDEIKGGVLIASHNLTDASTTFGRAADVVTIPTLHESCSRVHARIAFDSTGTPWLRDLGSGNGTLVNGKRMPSASIGKEVLSEAEIRRHREGSRGVVLFPGDTIKLGASTRMYCLNGPEEFDRGAAKARMEAAKLAVLNKKAHGGDGENNNDTKGDKQDGVSWGMSDDPAEEDDTQATSAAPDRPIQESDVPDKHRKLFENLRAKQHKLDAALEESQRIEAKAAHADLSDGQKTRLEQNRVRVEELKGKIEEAENELREKIWGSSARREKERSLHSSSNQMKGDDDDIDDLYDKTASRKRGRDNDDGKVETEQSLTAKWKELIAEWHKKKGESSAMQRRVSQLASKVARAEAAGDEDAFFMRNDLDLVQDNHKRLVKSLGNLEEELSDIEKLLRVVNDKLVVNRASSFVGLETDKPRAKAAVETDRIMMPPPPPAAMAAEKSVNSAMPPPAMMAPPPKRPSPGAAMMPPAPRPMPNGSALMPPPPMVVQRKDHVTSSVDMAPPPPKRSKPIGPPRGPGGGGGAGGGTLAAIRSAVSSQSSDRNANSSSSRPKGGIGAAPPPSDFARGGTNLTDSKEDKWQAPSDQDGSGMTRLNKKFEGRY